MLRRKCVDSADACAYFIFIRHLIHLLRSASEKARLQLESASSVVCACLIPNSRRRTDTDEFEVHVYKKYK